MLEIENPWSIKGSRGSAESGVQNYCNYSRQVCWTNPETKSLVCWTNPETKPWCIIWADWMQGAGIPKAPESED